MAAVICQQRRLWKLIGSVVSVGLFCFALWLLRDAVSQYDLNDITARLHEVPPAAIAWSAVFSLASYLALGGFDRLAIRHIGREVPLGRTLLASFISHAVSHSAGFAALTGGAIRWRFYTASGLSALEVGAVIVFCGWTFVVGAAVLAGLALLAEPGRFAALSGIGGTSLRLVGAVILVLITLYVVAGAWRRHPLRLFGRAITLPRPGIALAQIAVAIVDLSCVAAALWMLLPPGAPSFPALVGIYVLANLAGLVTHVPGGLGVFETAVVLMLPDLRGDAVLGALVLWRVTYNLLPLALGAVLMAAWEAGTRRRTLGRAARAARLWLREAEPALAAMVVFVAGAALLLGGAVPESAARRALLMQWLPPALWQGAHLVAAGVGMALLLTARGLFRRLAAAYHAALLLLALGGVLALLRGLDGEEAVVLALAALLLIAVRHNFYRAGTVATAGLSPAWSGAAVVVLIAGGWLSLLAFRGLPPDWTTAAVATDPAATAARSWRGTGTAGMVLLVGLGLLARQPPRPALPARPTPRDLDRAALLIAGGRRAFVNRALMGDFYLIFDSTGEALIAYQVLGRHWIALGDPVGRPEAWLDLAWRFRETCEAADGLPVFFHVPARPLYLDLGLALTPLGEELWVAPDRPPVDLRRRHALAAETGATFEMLPPGAPLPASLAALAGEAVTAAALARFGQAVMRRDGDIVAFAPLWQAAAGQEVSLGAIWRYPHAGDAEAFLLVETLRWAAQHGWHRFDLGLRCGIAPLPASLQRFSRLVQPRHGPPSRSPGPALLNAQTVHAALPAGISLPLLVREITRLR